MDRETRYAPGYVDPAAVAQCHVTVADYSAEARAHVEAFEAFDPPPSLELRALVFDLAAQAWCAGLDYGVARGSIELEALIQHFPGLDGALRVVAGHVGAADPPCGPGGATCTLAPTGE
jgi:hypothetical protein